MRIELTYNEGMGRFELTCPYEFRNIPKAAGLWYDPSLKVWHSKVKYASSINEQIRRVSRLMQYADDSAKRMVQSIVDEENNNAAKKSKNYEGDIPHPVGLEYLPYQEEGVRFIVENSNVLIADEMGLGKTIQAIGAINALHPENALVICPASLKLNWRAELERWLVHDYQITVLPQKNEKNMKREKSIVILNYDSLKKYLYELREWEWDILIVDECHCIKNPKAQRTKLILGGKLHLDGQLEKISPIQAKKKVFLTGTPILNRPVELFPILQSLDPNGLGSNFFRFALRYCGAYKSRFGWDFKGASNLDELGNKLKEFTLRRQKAQVLTQLPAKRRQVILLDSCGLENLLNAEKEAYQSFEAAEDDIKGRTAAFAKLSEYRRKVAQAKMPLVSEYIKNLLEEIPKVVVMCHHQESVDYLRKVFSDVGVYIDGRSSIEERDAAVNRFQNEEACKLFVGTIKTAGVGITLTAASIMVFAELDWVPGILSQAEDRIHRIGQNNSVLIQHLVLNNSLDARMVEILIEKQKILESVFEQEKLEVL